MMRHLGAVLLLASTVGCNGPSGAAASSKTAPDRSPTASSELLPATLTIDGMVCEGCAAAVTESLENVPGVMSAEIDFYSGTASISFDPNTTNVNALAAAIEGLNRDPAPPFRVVARSVL